MKLPYYFMQARRWPWTASLLGLVVASHAGHAQTTLYNPTSKTFNQTGSLYNTGTVRNAGTYLPTSGTLLVAGGDFINTGTIGAGTATVKLVESAAGASRSLSLAGAALPNLDLDVPGNTTLGSNGTVLGTLTLHNGHLLTSPAAGTDYVLTLGPAATLVGETETHYVKGRVAQARSLSGNSSIDFGGLGVAVNPAGSSFPLAVERRASLDQAGVSYGTNPAMPTRQGIDRIWALSSATTTLATPAMLTLSWLPADDHGLTFAGTNAQVWRSDDGGTNWVMQGPAQDGTGHSVSVAATRLNALYTVSTSAAPLPVTLAAFTAQPVSNEAVALTWSTASEINANRFEVERSTDGVRFIQLATITAQGTANTSQAYSYRDELLPTSSQTLYYRLRITDHDKSATYSPVRTVALPTTRLAALSIRVAPNPVTANTPTSLWITSPTSTAGTLTVLNALGQVIRTLKLPVVEGIQEVPLTIQDLHAGVYSLRIQVDSQAATFKLLVR